ncbi:MAG: clostripain-related cysteine peptidase [Anaerolineae bacterium]
MRKVTVLLLLLLGVFGMVRAQEVANWTILHYTDVDNNLEGAAFNDYYEMQTAGSGNGVNIVAQLDRAEGFESRFGDWTDTRRFFIEQVPALPTPDIDGKREAIISFVVAQGASEADVRSQAAALDDATINRIYENYNLGVSFEQTPVEDLGEVDMGDPQSLVDFLVWGVQNFPAEHYLVVIGSHGAGWRGIGPDEGGGESILELPEIDAALGEARAQLGIDKFDIVGFDACLMAVTDVAVTLEPHADYVLFSQEVIPSNGWEYAHSIMAMQQNPDWDAFQVGANFVDNYMAYYAGEGARTKVGLSLVDTAGLPNLLGALDNFAQVVQADTVELLSALGTARNNSQIFGASLGDRADFYSYVDLRDFMTWFSVQTTISEDAYNAAQEVIAAYDGAVVYALSDNALPGAHGLGIYLPSGPQYYADFSETYPAAAPAAMGFWQDYLNQFYSTIVTELDGSALQLNITNVFTLGETGSSIDNPVIFFDAAGVGVVDMSYTIAYIHEDGSRTIVDTYPISYTSILPTGETIIEYPNELTPSTFNWSVEFPFISDSEHSVLSLLQSSGASNEGYVQGTYVNAEGSQPAYLVFNTGTLEYVGMLALADDAPYQANPLPGDQFIVDVINITPEGETSVTPLVDSPLVFGTQPFTLQYAPACQRGLQHHPQPDRPRGQPCQRQHAGHD